MPTFANYWSVEHEDAPYTVYDVTLFFHGKMGNFVQGKAGPVVQGVATCEIVQLEQPTMTVRAEWTARRSGLPPTLPDWRVPASPGAVGLYVLHEVVLGVKDPILQADGVTYTIIRTGAVEYFLRVPLDPATGFPSAAAPYQTLQTSQVGISAAEFRAAIFPFSGDLSITR